MTNETTTESYGLREARKGRIRITNRTEKCNCGCGGTDPWHKRDLTRTIQGIEVLDAPQTFESREGRSYEVSAIGRAKHPAGERWVGLRVWIEEGRPPCEFGWVFGTIVDPEGCK